jgi:DNA mismatch repair ATPase MutS
VTALLCRTSDSQRLVQKFSLGRGDADDLISLGKTIRMTERIVKGLENASPEGSLYSTEEATQLGVENQVIENLVRRLKLQGTDRLAKAIEDTIDEEGLMKTHIIEDTEASNMMALAERVMTAEGETSVASRTANHFPSETKPTRPALSIRKGTEEGIWIMKVSYDCTIISNLDSSLTLSEQPKHY